MILFAGFIWGLLWVAVGYWACWQSNKAEIQRLRDELAEWRTSADQKFSAVRAWTARALRAERHVAAFKEIADRTDDDCDDEVTAC